MEFKGAKLALFIGDALLTILRDERKDIPWPGYWDLPGGGREGGETPQACALRETHEEVGLRLTCEELRGAEPVERPHGRVWFFAAHLPEAARADIRFGGEGQRWELMPPEVYLGHPRRIPAFAGYVARYLGLRGLGQAENGLRHGKAPRG